MIQYLGGFLALAITFRLESVNRLALAKMSIVFFLKSVNLKLLLVLTSGNSASSLIVIFILKLVTGISN
ncbi:hypothetical protein IA01_09555 [Flavobacterium psychrophilum]|nr:hypothetical protein IA03_09520 [Flavobacterium psychrophilum]AIG32969.1 hypothetical protein IA01_09555 [Flavobacterium psychrophilum]AIG35124.1 hypothetical protein IA02_08940 [Flavobacterium psychrophilum]AIG37489.1 hypothetical protein IA04_09460 [Flavobacterium psychrophilum]AIG39753.1 hypothetical protein IA05_09530 [Flavobacterium psychrophilum]